MTPNDEMIARILYLPPDKNRLHNEQSAQSVIEHMVKNKINNRNVYNILEQIWKDTDLYPYVKQHKSKRNGRGAFYAIHSRWLDLNHVNVTASEAELALQMWMTEKRKHGTRKNMLSNM